jgi:hypothetical protein
MTLGRKNTIPREGIVSHQQLILLTTLGGHALVLSRGFGWLTPASITYLI